MQLVAVKWCYRVRSREHQGDIVIPPVKVWTTVEIVGGVQPAPVFGTVGNLSSSFCTNLLPYHLQTMQGCGTATR